MILMLQQGQQWPLVFLCPGILARLMRKGLLPRLIVACRMILVFECLGRTGTTVETMGKLSYIPLGVQSIEEDALELKCKISILVHYT